MAAYGRFYGFGHLRANSRGPGSAGEPYARFEYGTTFTFAFNWLISVSEAGEEQGTAREKVARRTLRLH